MKILVTGIAGFVGSHLVDYLLKKDNLEIHGFIEEPFQSKVFKHIKDKINFYEVDIRDFNKVKNIIEEIKPDKIFHLAAQSSAAYSFQAPRQTFFINTEGFLNILEAVRLLKINPFIQIPGSSDEYGLVYEDELPVKETNPLRPLSPYAVSKITQDFLGYQYYKSYGLNIVRTRIFHQTGIRRPDKFVISSFAKQIALIEKGKKEPIIHVGNLDVTRDFLDVADVAAACCLALEKGKPGEVYNICSGKGYKLKEILEMLFVLTDKKIEIAQDPQRLRPSDIPIIIGDAAKFKKETGWQPQIPIEETLKNLLNWWRDNI